MSLRSREYLSLLLLEMYGLGILSPTADMMREYLGGTHVYRLLALQPRWVIINPPFALGKRKGGAAL